MTTYQHSATFHPASMAGAVAHSRYPQATWRLGQSRPTVARLARWVVAVLMVLVVTLAAIDLTMGYTFDGSAGAQQPVPSYGLDL